MLDAAPISERPRGLKALDLRSLMPDADASDVRDLGSCNSCCWYTRYTIH